jgi:hypothetical protein
LNRSGPRLDGEREREPAHGIERDAEPPCPLPVLWVRTTTAAKPEPMRENVSQFAQFVRGITENSVATMAFVSEYAGG